MQPNAYQAFSKMEKDKIWFPVPHVKLISKQEKWKYIYALLHYRTHKKYISKKHFFSPTPFSCVDWWILKRFQLHYLFKGSFKKAFFTLRFYHPPPQETGGPAWEYSRQKVYFPNTIWFFFVNGVKNLTMNLKKK